MNKVLTQTFKTIFGSSPQFSIQAPGRVNLIGEHTDYNEGFVLPMTIHLSLEALIRPRDDHIVSIHSCNFNQQKSFSLQSIVRENKDEWLQYAKGMAYVLQNKGFSLKGFDAVLHGNIPWGAGLSSSAAFELCIANAFALSSHFPWQPREMAQLAQQAENEWVGMKCGIMDQMVIAQGKKDHAILMDCRSLSIEAIPLPADVAVVVMDTMTRRGLVGSEYNERRRLCEVAAKALKVRSLREVSWDHWASLEKQLPVECRLKAKHVLSENDRVLKAALALRDNDKKMLGKCFYESHVSLRDDFQVTSGPLDKIVECSWKHAACIGARMTGGGFAGCAVALVERKMAEDFCRYVAREYEKETKLTPGLYVTHAVEGVTDKQV